MQPFDIVAVFDDDQNAASNVQAETAVGGAWPGAYKYINEKRQRGRGGNRRERNVPPEQHHNQEKHYGHSHGRPADCQENTQRRGHSLSARKLQPHGKDVPEDCGEAREHHEADVAVGKMAGNPDG